MTKTFGILLILYENKNKKVYIWISGVLGLGLILPETRILLWVIHFMKLYSPITQPNVHF